MLNNTNILDELNHRSREVFRKVVEGYLESGDPIGSRSLTRTLDEKISAATIRNVMQDLENMGLLNSPHISAGRIPTQSGLRMFVDGLLEVGTVDEDVRQKMKRSVSQEGLQETGAVEGLLDRVGSALSGLTQGASLVLTPKMEAPLKHIEFVSLAPDRALVVLVFEDGRVENRIFTPPLGHTGSSLQEATNFMNSFVANKTLAELQHTLKLEIQKRRQEIDSLTADLIENGDAFWENEDEKNARLIVRGRSHLLSDNEGVDLDLIKTLFDDLEHKRDIAEFLELTEEGEGVRIFIGSENKLFSLSGSSLVVSPYMNDEQKIIGAVGVIGPTRLNYGRIVPIVDYTAQLVGRVLSAKR